MKVRQINIYLNNDDSTKYYVSKTYNFGTIKKILVKNDNISMYDDEKLIAYFHGFKYEAFPCEQTMSFGAQV